MIGLAFLVGAILVACGVSSEEDQPKKLVVEEEEVEKTEEVEDEVFFKEEPVVVDYSKSPEEILVNYTEKGMNQFKVNFPDTLSMNYALQNIGKEAPEIKGKTLDDKEISLSDLKDKKVIINFSKTTCTICADMEKVMSSVQKDNEDIVFLNVFPVDKNKDIQAYYKKLKKDVPKNALSLEANKGLKELAVDDYKIAQVPTFIFVDEKGLISNIYIGNKDATMFQDMIDTAYGNEKLHDNLRTVTIRVDKDGNEIVEEKLVDEDGVDHTKSEDKPKKDFKEDRKKMKKTSKGKLKEKSDKKQ